MPAVKEADMDCHGYYGTDVTEASAMVLMDDNFTTIVSAVSKVEYIRYQVY